MNRNADLVERCKSGVRSLSAHVEALPVADLGKCAAPVEAVRGRTLRAIDALAALYNSHGSLSEEIQSL
jgi:hypothetical protein